MSSPPRYRSPSPPFGVDDIMEQKDIPNLPVYREKRAPYRAIVHVTCKNEDVNINVYYMEGNNPVDGVNHPMSKEIIRQLVPDKNRGLTPSKQMDMFVNNLQNYLGMRLMAGEGNNWSWTQYHGYEGSWFFYCEDELPRIYSFEPNDELWRGSRITIIYSMAFSQTPYNYFHLYYDESD